MAAKHGFLDNVKLLVEYGASTEVKNQNGEKPSDVAYDIVIKNCLLQSLETMVHSNKKYISKKVKFYQMYELIIG